MYDFLIWLICRPYNEIACEGAIKTSIEDLAKKMFLFLSSLADWLHTLEDDDWCQLSPKNNLRSVDENWRIQALSVREKADLAGLSLDI